MKKFLAPLMIGAAVAVLSSCAPLSYVMDLQRRTPSSSGLDLNGKSISVVYLQSRDGSDSLFNNAVADALAYGLESDYFDGEEAISVYNLPKEDGGDYASRDTLSQYVMLLDSDVVMILDTPKVSPVATGKSKTIASLLYVYDSMNEEDVVHTFQSRTMTDNLKDLDRALNVGGALAGPLVNDWKYEIFTLVYFDDFNPKWTDAITLASDFKWDEAMEIWMELSKHSNAVKASSARYNTALACFMLDELDLAKEWLDASDKAYPLSVNKTLRKRIAEREKGKTTSD